MALVDFLSVSKPYAVQKIIDFCLSSRIPRHLVEKTERDVHAVISMNGMPYSTTGILLWSTYYLYH